MQIELILLYALKKQAIKGILGKNNSISNLNGNKKL
jgi:hypothetical protein